MQLSMYAVSILLQLTYPTFLITAYKVNLRVPAVYAIFTEILMHENSTSDFVVCLTPEIYKCLM